jgi:hypothetical protein
MTLDQRVGRFSAGQETNDESPEHARVGRFSDGQAALAEPGRGAVGRFSAGQELLAETAQHRRVGSFGDQEPERQSISMHRQTEANEDLEVETVSS